MKDFTLHTFRKLLDAFQDENYSFQTFSDFIRKREKKSVLIRHDIDLKKKTSLNVARIENDMGISATYYFRAIKKIFDPNIISEIIRMNHEVGYHYEDLSSNKGDYSKAIESFEANLEMFRNVSKIETICMHGNSLSKYDNRSLWKNYDYRKYDIIGEPYFDLDFNEVLYLTDSTQRWNGGNIAVRDKVTTNFHFDFGTTFDIIGNIKNLPNQIMITVHPDRWTNNIFEWHHIDKITKVKNFIKKNILSKRADLYEHNQ